MISIIIPTFNEADQIQKTIRNTCVAKETHDVEIIIADGGSTDGTVELAQALGATTIVCDKKGRGAQMNRGASIAKGDVLYFLHADSIPPHDFIGHILAAISSGASAGCFRLQFDYDHWFLKANCWFTRFNVNAVRFGDQSLFVYKNVFVASGTFREDLLVMEDQEIIHRMKKLGSFKVMKADVVTSARKYHDNGIYNMQWIFFRIWLLYYLGYSQQHIVHVYKSLIRKHKL